MDLILVIVVLLIISKIIWSKVEKSVEKIKSEEVSYGGTDPDD